MNRLAARLVVGLVVAILAAPALGAADWRDDLKRPISPGALALLVGHSEAPVVIDRWGMSLRHDDPHVRAAAARMAGVSGATSLLPMLLAALDKETDEGAGVEEVRAIAAVGGMETDAALLTIAQRLGPWATRAYAGMLARTRGTGAVPFINALGLTMAGNRSTFPSRIVRSIGDLPGGLLADLIKVTGCKFSKDRPLGGAEIVYDEAGRVKTLSPLKSDLTDSCEQAARAALRTAFGPPAISPGIPQVVVAVIDPEVIACLDERPSDVAEQIAGPPVPRGSGVIKAPQKIHDVRPVYPVAAQNDRTQGVVFIEAEIAKSGCVQNFHIVRVQNLRIEREPDSLLAVAGLQAVSGWRYTQALLDGEPVPVIMTVSVGFRLQ